MKGPQPSDNPNFRVIRYVSEMGRSHYMLRCLKCQGKVKAFPWSWAGHGVKICPHCKARFNWWDIQRAEEES